MPTQNLDLALAVARGKVIGMKAVNKFGRSPDAELTNFLIKHERGLVSTGTTSFLHTFNPYFAIPGPAIIKMAAIASADNNAVDGGFDLYLVDN